MCSVCKDQTRETKRQTIYLTCHSSQASSFRCKHPIITSCLTIETMTVKSSLGTEVIHLMQIPIV